MEEEEIAVFAESLCILFRFPLVILLQDFSPPRPRDLLKFI